MKNSSGWVGYSLATIYPNMGDQVTQTLATAPDAEDIEALSGQEPEKRVKTPINGDSKKQIWLVLAALIGFILIFGIPGKAKAG